MCVRKAMSCSSIYDLYVVYVPEPSFTSQSNLDYTYLDHDGKSYSFQDVLLNTDLSVDGLATIEQEYSYLCPSHVEYARPLR